MKFLRPVMKLLSIAAIAVLIEGCKKDDPKGNATCMVATASETGTLGDENVSYSYTNGQVSTVTFSTTNGSLAETITYDANGRPIKTTVLDTLVTTYTYDANNRLSQFIEVDGHSRTIGKSTYTYSASGQLVGQQDYEDDNGSIAPFQHYVITYPNTTTHNASTVSTYNDYSDGSLHSVDTFQFDSHKVASAGSNYLEPDYTDNNPTKIIRTDASGNLVNTTTYTYTFNSNDYPLSVTESSTGNSNGLDPQSSTITYTYNCK